MEYTKVFAAGRKLEGLTVERLVSESEATAWGPGTAGDRAIEDCLKDGKEEACAFVGGMPAAAIYAISHRQTLGGALPPTSEGSMSNDEQTREASKVMCRSPGQEDDGLPLSLRLSCSSCAPTPAWQLGRHDLASVT